MLPDAAIIKNTEFYLKTPNFNLKLATKHMSFHLTFQQVGVTKLSQNEERMWKLLLSFTRGIPK